MPPTQVSEEFGDASTTSIGAAGVTTTREARQDENVHDPERMVVEASDYVGSASTNLRAGSSSIPGANIHTFVPMDEDINIRDYEFDSASEPDLNFSKLKSDNPKMAPNLYCMLYLYKDNGVNGLVDKVILSRQEMERFCNDVVPGSFRSLTDVDYTKLCKLCMHYIGVYGNPVMIAQLLHNVGAISTETLQTLREQCEAPYDSRQELAPMNAGIYLYHHKPSGCGLVIHWPERGSFADNASSDKKKNMINFQRYLCKLTDIQVCLLTKDDVDSFKWKDEDTLEDFMEDNESDTNCFEFEVQKNQEQKEDFTFREGFKIRIAGSKDRYECCETHIDLDLRPEIVESRHHQTLVTKRLIPASVTHLTKHESISCRTFEQKMRQMLPSCKLVFADVVTVDDYGVFIKHAGVPRELANQCLPVMEDERRQIQQNFKAQQLTIQQNINNELDTTTQWVERHLRHYLHGMYPTLVESTDRETPEASDESDLPLEHRDVINSEIRDLISVVNSTMWRQKKKRFFLARVLASYIWRNRDSTSSSSSIVELVSKIFFDKERELYPLVRRNLPDSKNSWVTILFKGDETFKVVDKIMHIADEKLRSTSDSEFTDLLCFVDIEEEDAAAIPDFANIVKIFQATFVEPFERWASSTLRHDIKSILNSKFNSTRSIMLGELGKAENKEIADLEEASRLRIRQLLMDKYDSGCTLYIKTIKQREVKKNSYSYMTDIVVAWEYELETPKPPKVQLAFHETRLDQADFQKLATDAIDDESYFPSPQFYGYGAQTLPSLEYDPQIYSLRKMYQLENGKILCILHNIQNHATELYYEKASRIGGAIATGNSFRKFAREFELTAFEDINGLFAVYSSESGSLNVFSFDENRSNLFSRNANIQILPWYNNVPPEISQILFITGTEDLCFVETNGRARLYSLVTGQFQPVVAEFPHNSVIRCSPDGACLIAFESSRTDSAEDIEDVITDPIMSDEDEHSVLDASLELPRNNASATHIERNTEETDLKSGEVVAYVHFVKNLTVVSKVVRLPAIGDLHIINLSALAGRQIHLLYISASREHFASKILKITVEKNEWRFNERTKAALTMGKIRFKVSAKTHQDSQFIEGNCTAFSKTVKPGDCIVIKGERRLVKEIRSDTLLVINGAFPASAIDGSVGQFVDFKVERKPTSNGYVDCYSNMYERYPIDSYIQDNNEVRASPATALHIILGISGQQLADSNYSERFSRYIMEAFSDLLKTTNKPALSLKNFSLGTDSIDNLDIIQFCRRSKPRPIGKWLIQMACLLPIQIAIAMDNHFVPLKDGVITDMDATCGVGASLATVSEAITFGWYESVFNFYGDHEIKAVSSMGEQSTGKSYLLNHLCGSTFDGSAQRCTEGVWMSLVPTAKTLYVVMDFEGLRSLERTPQEDLFLTLFNAAVSNLILYKNNFALGRDISSMFHRFQDGATIFDPSSTSHMFTSRLAIIIKDVPKQDRVGIVHEFRSKFTQIVSEEGEDNFISRLHKGQMSILPWPVFNDSGFYSTLSVLKKYLDDQESKFGKARIFLPTIKTIMAKLKVCDWSSLDSNMVQIRASAIRFLIKQAVASGAEEVEPTLEHLKNLDTGDIIEDDTVTFNDLFDGTGIIINDHPIMSDCGLNLSPLPGNSFRDFSSKLRAFFEKHAQERESTPIDADWYALYSAFVKHMIARRIRRARQWFSANTARFPSDHPEISAASYELEQESDRLVAAWSLCGLTCGNCSLRCLEQRDHSGHHDCFTDHRCKYGCEFAQDHRSSQTPPCSMPAGHDGAHVCTESEHFCGEPCALNGKRNCQGICMMQIGHGGESHLCASRVHYCGEACSLSNVADSTSGSQFSCKNMCIVPYEEPHTVHKCENMMACPLRCCLPQCNKKCSSNDHFHALLNPSEAHICGDDHQCVEECEAKGICEIQIQPKAQEEHYVNMHGTFAYTKYVQTSKRLACYKKIPVGQLTHPGKHIHATVDKLFHFCETKCPYCEYYCTLPYGHPQMEHETAHGNTIQTVFSAVDDEFEYNGFTFNTGDRGSCFLCNMFCKDLGRHKHIDYCQSAASTTCSGEGIQHISEKINPDPDRPKDFVKHGLYWKRMGFKDPYSKDDQEFFSKCDALCCGEEHQIKATQAASSAEGSNAITPTKSYCELPLFHAPLPDGSAPPNGGVGYVSVDGHYFKCQNPAMIGSDFHIIFVIDRSGSMASTDCKPLPNTPVERQLRITHNNRLGAVYDAVHRFVHTRQSTLRNRALGGATSTSPSNSNDTVSMVLFDDKVVTAFANETLVGFGGVVSEMQKHLPRGGTSFGVGIKQATDVCVQHHDQRRVPVIIFLSDGGCTDNFQNAMGLQQLFDSTASVGVKPFLITVRFGNDMSGAQMLRSMADYAEKHHKNTASRQTSSAFNSSRSFKCAYFEALDEFQLAECFTGLAKSLKEYKPALIRR